MARDDELDDDERALIARHRARRKGRRVVEREYELTEEEFSRRYGYLPEDDGAEHEVEESEPEQPKAKGGSRYFGR